MKQRILSMMLHLERHGSARPKRRSSAAVVSFCNNSLRAALLLLLSATMVVGPASCGISSPSEPVGTAKQAGEGDHIIPAGPGAPIGYLQGMSSVSPSGSYQYSIPLDVPPGRAGMQPSLALAYTSSAGVDSVGAGWSVAGGSSIIRLCSPTFATNGQVGFPSQFCLDQQQLINVPGTNGIYHTEHESFAEIRSFGSGSMPNSWQVRLKDGRIRTYEAVRYDGTETRFWALASERDRRGNAVRYYYDHQEHWESCTPAQKADPVANPECAAPFTHFSFELERIEYTANEGEQPRRKVVFHHDPRDPQVKPTFVRMWDDAKQAFDFRDVSRPLGLIEMYGPTEGAWTGTPSLAWSYDLTYTTSPDTGRQLLASVKKCSASNGCFLAREFSYAERSPGASDSYKVIWEITRPEPVPAEDIRILDATRDGKDDIFVARVVDEDTFDFESYLYASGDSSTYSVTADPPGPDGVPVDLNGDGSVELIATRMLSLPPNLQWEQWVYKYEYVAGVFTPFVKLPDTPALWLNDPYVTGYHPLYTDKFPVLLGDLDGDGLPDLCRSRPGYTLYPPDLTIERKWTCARNLGDFLSGQGFGPWGFVEHTTMVGDGEEFLADLDGDARVEFHHGPAAIGDRAGDGRPEVLVASGPDAVTVGDFDGDGRDDVVDDMSLTVDYAHPNPGAQHPGAHRSGSIAHLGTFRGDFDGNGRDDLLLMWMDADYHTHMKAITMDGPDPDRLVEVRDEDADWRERVTYTRELAPDWDPTSCSTNHPNTCVRRGFSVVSRIESRTGTPRDRQFAYYTPTYDRHGRGFLGFNRVHEWQPDRPMLRVTWYDNNQDMDQGVYPDAFHPGLTLEVVPIIEQLWPGGPIQQLSSANARITYTEYRYQVDKDPVIGTYSIVPDPVSSWNSKEWEQNVSINWNSWPHIDDWWLLDDATPAFSKLRQGVVQYDQHGNLTFSEERTLGGPHPTLGTINGTRRTTTITYEARPAEDWLNGLVDQVQVTAEAPDGTIKSRTTKYVHDWSGLVESSEQMPNGSVDEQQLISYTRNARGLITDVTATTGGATARVQHIAYDDEGVHQAQTWNDYGHMTSVQVHPTLAVPMVKTDPNGVTDHWVYDDLGRPRQVLPQAGSSSTTQYQPWIENGLVQGTVVSVSSQDGAESETRLDDQGRAVTSRSRDFAGQWRSASVDRDLLGRVANQERPHYAGAPAPGTAFRYDSLGRVVETLLPDNTSRISTYDFLEAAHRDALNNEEELTYDFDGRVVRSSRHALPTPWDAGSTIVSTFAYEPFGQIKTITDNVGNQIHMSYDHRGRPYQTIHPDRGQTIVQYNGHGEVQWAQTAAGTSIYMRDDLGRVTQVTTADGINEVVWDTSPNGLGKLASTNSFDGIKVDYTYDANGRSQDVTWRFYGGPTSFVISTAYDGLGRLEALEYPEVSGIGRTRVEYEYNSHGYLEQVLDVSPTVAPKTVLWTVGARNEDDALLTAQGGDWTTTRNYDANSGRLEEIKVVDASAMTDVFDLTYKYDDNGAVALREELVEARRETFHMDGHHRLKEWLLEYDMSGPNAGTRASMYTYDAVDNLQNVSVSGSAILPYIELFTSGNAGKPHALYNKSLPNAPQTFFYDARGRLINGDGRQYTYTSFDLPRTITTATGVTRFEYDASGTRVNKWGPSGQTISIGGLYERREESSGMSHVFVVTGSDGPIAQIVYRPSTNDREVHYLHQDGLGSVDVTTAKGVAASRNYYEPFGARIDVEGSPVAGPAQVIRNGFTGHHHDDDLGLIDMRGRVYDPGTRRFLTPDPLARLDENPYAYVTHDPLNWIDPSGFSPEKPDWWERTLGFVGWSAWTSSSSPSPALTAQSGLVGQVAAAVMAMQFPKGNDAPNASGCPTGTGTAPAPCAGAGNAGCPAVISGEPSMPPRVHRTPPPFGASEDFALAPEAPYCRASNCHQPGRLGGAVNPDTTMAHVMLSPLYGAGMIAAGSYISAVLPKIKIPAWLAVSGAATAMAFTFPSDTSEVPANIGPATMILSFGVGPVAEEALTTVEEAEVAAGGVESAAGTARTWESFLPEAERRLADAYAKYGGEGVLNMAERFNPHQAALIDLAKRAHRTGVSPAEADALMEWAAEYGIPARNDIGTVHWVGGDHIHIGPVNHIRVQP